MALLAARTRGSRRTLPSEFELVARYFAPLSRAFPGAYGLRDDVALIRSSPGHELALKTDVIVAGVDFTPDTPPELIARKGLRVNLSDLAAKGARPRAYLLDLLLPDTIDEAWVAGFAAGLELDQAEYDVHLIGGDTSSTPGVLAVAVSAVGEVPIDRTLRRGGARPGDRLYLTGTIGDAALGLAAGRGELPQLDPRSTAFLMDRLRLPRPRVALGPHLIGLATAAIDVSDGLVADLRHLCTVSRLSAVIEAHAVPLSPAALAVIEADPAYLARALTGGDDYEILFTAPADAAPRIAELAVQCCTSIAAIGVVSAGSGGPAQVTVLGPGGQPMSFSTEGWTHFGGRSA